MSRNVPAQHLLLTLSGNPAVVVIFKLVWSKLLAPRVATSLSLFKYATRDPLAAGPELTVRVHKTQVTSSVLFELVVVVLAPVVFVLVLDESCLRYYLAFARELASLMDAWRIDQRGWGAYRPGFCSRRLLSEFSYVWLIYALMRGLFSPAVALIRTRPKTRRLVAWLRRMCACGREPDERAAVLSFARSSQSSLAGMLTFIIVISTFGVAVPVLLLFAPLMTWLRCCALDLTDRHLDDERSSRFGDALVTRCLVQVPVMRVVVLALLSMWTVACLIFVDLGFDLGPMLFYAVFCAVTLGSRLLCRRHLPNWWWRGPGTSLCEETAVNAQEVVAASKFDLDADPGMVNVTMGTVRNSSGLGSYLQRGQRLSTALDAESEDVVAKDDRKPRRIRDWECREWTPGPAHILSLIHI
eukprot:TRINITY_DN15617_c0_g1_i1.p1 TRINITY_DN15617_c0_g1~~TRINITY_DN15617_c0_g1_i1.p1  ORF type:complete len:413 (+),score=63.32 TRINITY_DN15617_c0_g1_i1:345-1583(+)